MSEPDLRGSNFPGQSPDMQRIQSYQFGRLRKIVRYAYDNVPLYRQKYDAAGIKPQDIRSLSDFKFLPLLTKEELQAGFPGEILSRKIPLERCYIVSTSGHSGSPVKLYRKKDELYIIPFLFPVVYPFLPWAMRYLSGVKTSRRYSAILPFDENYDLYRIVKIVSRFPEVMRHDLQFMSTGTETDILYRELSRHKPDTLSANLITLKNIIAFAARNGSDVPRVKLIFVGGELIDKNSRRLLEQTFGARVCEHYGSEEAGTIAMECPCSQGLHLYWRSSYLELLNNGADVPADTPGQVVVTNLRNRATPIIRYSGMGDVATFSASPCACRQKSPLLKMVDGRMVDSFVLPDGRIIHPSSLTIPLENIPGIWRFQIRQEKKDLVRMLLVITDSFRQNARSYDSTDLCQQIIHSLRQTLGDSVQIVVDIVDDIPQPAGSRHKLQTVVSMVNRQIGA